MSHEAREALIAFLPLARRRFDIDTAKALTDDDREADYSAGKWLEVILLAEFALKEAGVAVELPRPRLQVVSRRAQ